MGWQLKVQSSHYGIGGLRFILLYEMTVAYALCKFALRESFEEVAAAIFEDARLNDINTLNIALVHLHNRLPFTS